MRTFPMHVPTRARDEDGDGSFYGRGFSSGERNWDNLDDSGASGGNEDRSADHMTFALSVSPEKTKPVVIPPPVAEKKPLRKLNPNASAFIPTQIGPTAVVGEGVSKETLANSFAQKSQVMVEKGKNEFSINYDDPKIKARVTHKDFEVLKLVGEGAFGKVFQVRHILSKRIYAMKTLRKRFLVDTNNVGYTFVERNVLRKVRHPFICGLHFAFQTKGKVCLVMDFLNGGQIFYHLKRQTMFGEAEVQFYAAEITLALSHLHSLGILHRDLKPENILLDGKGHVHLTDFGLARDLAEASVSKTDTYCGTVEYMAPEMIQGQDYGKEVDWWSLGILVYDMLTGAPPWTDPNEDALCEKIMNEKLVLPSFLTDDVKSILKGLLQRDPLKRFGPSELQAHEFFNGLSWSDVLEKKIEPPFVPAVPGGDLSTLNFDDKFIKRKNVSAITPSDTTEELSKSQEALFMGFSYVRDSDANV